MDFANLTFAGLFAIGVVNVATFFRPDLDSKTKFVISVAAAFLASFVPADLGNQIAERLIGALEIAFASSGGYKVAQKVGGK